MGKFDPKSIRDASDIGARLKDIEAKLRSLETSSGLDSASFSGTLRVAPGGALVVDGGADITMNGGGTINGRDGSAIELFHPGNREAVFQAGTLSNGSGVGYGIQINSDTRQNIFLAGQNTQERFVAVGDPQEPPDRFASWSKSATLRTIGGSLLLEPDNGSLVLGNIATNTGTAIGLTAGNVVVKISSSRRYKQDIEDTDADPGAVLRLRPRQWRYISAVEELGNGASPSRGFIAEEVEEAGLTAAVIRDEAGEPDALDTAALLAGVVALCQRQQAELDELRSRIEAMENGHSDSP